MDAYDPIVDSADETPDLAAALCHQLRLPLDHVLDRIQRAHDALRARNAPSIDGATLKALRCLADAHVTTRHLLRLVDDVDGQAPVVGGRMRRLDVRGVVRAGAAMLPELDIAVDAPDAVFVDGIDTRLVHVFTTLLADVATDELALVARIRVVDEEARVELLADGGASARPWRRRGTNLSAVGRGVVRHIVAAHRGRLERWPSVGPGVLVRVGFPAAVAPTG